jgi:Kef-type K+ transport system membrane component KefB
MSLKAFHILFIVASILLCWGVGAWFVHRGNLPAGVGCIAAGFALVGYGVYFLKKLKKVNK